MKEIKPFELIHTFDQQIIDKVVSESMNIPYDKWWISSVPALKHGRVGLNLTTSDKWVQSEGKSGAFANSVGTFKWLNAINTVPTAKLIIEKLQNILGSQYIGQSYISRIKPGYGVLPHTDGFPYYELHHRIQVCLSDDINTVFHCADESKVFKKGECWIFSNMDIHSVDNNGLSERWAMVVDLTIRTP